MANVLATFAQFERRLIGQRTKDALAAKKRAGIQLGRRSTLSATTVERIVRERQAGSTLKSIADELNVDGVTTGQGGRRWYPSTVSSVLAAAERRST